MFTNIVLLLLFTFIVVAFSEKHVNTSSNPHRSPTENLHLHLFEGDILIRRPTGGRPPFSGRTALNDKQSRWSEGIVYYELDSSSYSEEDIEVIKSAMEQFEEFTCIKWRERNGENNYVEIENDMGCSSEIGMQEGGQSIYLQSPDCIQKGVIMHELMHALGFWHELSRPDRDDYVSIEWDNIIPGMKENFKKLPVFMVDDLGLPYDYRSLMHYKAWAFAQDYEHPTSIPKDPSVSLSDLGKGETEGIFTDNDLQKIKLYYEC